MTTLEKVLKFDADIEELQEKKKQALTVLLDETCLLQIGDRVEVTGYAHEGKMMEVNHRYIGETYFNGYRWIVKDYIIKKDGKPSEANRGEVIQSRYKS